MALKARKRAKAKAAKGQAPAKPGKTKRESKGAADPEGLVSPAQYAKRIGVTRQAVMRMIHQSQLVESISRAGRYFKIDPEAADAERARNVQPRRDLTPLGTEEGAAVTAGRVKLTEAKTATEIARAERERLQLLELRGDLVRVSAMEQEFFNVGRIVRDAILALPARIAAELAAMQDSKEVAIFLEGELVKAMEEFGRMERKSGAA